MAMEVRETAIMPRSVEEVVDMAQRVAASGLFPVRKPDEAFVILLTGQELGLKPMQAMRGIPVVSGRPVLSADLMVAIIRRSGLCRSWRVLESTADRCEITTQRVDEDGAFTRVWTKDDAQRAGLVGRSGPWTQYPAQMLRHRVAADLAREAYPDVVLGLYTADEMGAEEPERVEVRAEVVNDRAPDPLAAWQRALSEVGSLADLALAWGEHQVALHGADVATRATQDAEAHLRELGYTMATQEVRQALAGNLGGSIGRWLDVLARVDSADDVVGHVRNLPGMGESSVRLAKLCASRLIARLQGHGDTRKGADWLRTELTRTTPPDGPRGGGNEHPTVPAPADAHSTTVPTNTPPANATAWTGTREGIDAHAATLRAVPHVLASARSHGASVPEALREHMVAAYAARVVALSPADDHGATLAPATADAMVRRALNGATPFVDLGALGIERRAGRRAA